MKVIENIINKIKKWWEGEYIPPPPEDYIGNMPIVSAGYNKKPFLKHLWLFWKKEWKILLPIIVGAAVALFIHFNSKSTSKAEQEKNNRIPDVHIIKPLNINLNYRYKRSNQDAQSKRATDYAQEQPKFQRHGIDKFKHKEPPKK